MAYDKFGLRELKKDSRDYQLGFFVDLPKIEELPEEFELTTLFPIKHQGDTDYCSAYSSCGVSELQEEVELYPPYSFALSKFLSGDLEAWGQNLRDACRAHVKFGALRAKDAIGKPQNRDLMDYPPQWQPKAKKHKKQSYFAISRAEGDYFDAIKQTIWKYRDERRAVMLGMIWSWGLTDYILDEPKESGYGHAVYCTGWGKDGLIIVNSYGERAGKNGKHRATREVINTFVPRFGAYTFLDIPSETARVQNERAEWYFASWWSKIKILIRDLWKK